MPFIIEKTHSVVDPNPTRQEEKLEDDDRTDYMGALTAHKLAPWTER